MRPVVKLKNLGPRYVASSSIVMLPRIKNAALVVIRVMWCMVLILTLSGIIWHIYQVVSRYYQYPVKITIRLHATRKMMFPAVTICNLNPVKKTTIECDAEYQDIVRLDYIMTNSSLKVANLLYKDNEALDMRNEKHWRCKDVVQRYRDDMSFGEISSPADHQNTLENEIDNSQQTELPNRRKKRKAKGRPAQNSINSTPSITSSDTENTMVSSGSTQSIVVYDTDDVTVDTSSTLVDQSLVSDYIAATTTTASTEYDSSSKIIMLTINAGYAITDAASMTEKDTTTKLTVTDTTAKNQKLPAAEKVPQGQTVPDTVPTTLAEHESSYMTTIVSSLDNSTGSAKLSSFWPAELTIYSVTNADTNLGPLSTDSTVTAGPSSVRATEVTLKITTFQKGKKEPQSKKANYFPSEVIIASTAIMGQVTDSASIGNMTSTFERSSEGLITTSLEESATDVSSNNINGENITTEALKTSEAYFTQPSNSTAESIKMNTDTYIGKRTIGTLADGVTTVTNPISMQTPITPTSNSLTSPEATTSQKKPKNAKQKPGDISKTKNNQKGGIITSTTYAVITQSDMQTPISSTSNYLTASEATTTARKKSHSGAPSTVNTSDEENNQKSGIITSTTVAVTTQSDAHTRVNSTGKSFASSEVTTRQEKSKNGKQKQNEISKKKNNQKGG